MVDATETSPAPESSSDVARKRQIEDLQRRRDEILKSEAGTFEREEQLRSRSITRTVAGFLLWLGYASVVATGSVLALVMNGVTAFDVRPLAAATRALVGSIFPSLPLWCRLFLGLGLAVAVLWIVASVFIACDRLLRKQWQWHERTSGDAAAQMSPQALTPQTYSGFVALLPFVFAIATVMTLFSLAPGSASSDANGAFLASLFPGVGYSFVGIAIAFLSTAAFAMYFVYLVQPRGAGRTSVFRNGWEFALPPLALIAALALAPAHGDVVAARWLPWVAFMLLSSLVLACGLVFHGVFKDAKHARERLIRIDRRLARLTGVPADAGDDELEKRNAAHEPATAYRRWLEQLRVRLGRRRLDAAHVEPTRNAVADDLHAVPSNALVPFYRALDVSTAPELVRQIEERRATARRIDSDLRDLDAAIAGLEQVLSFQPMNELRHRVYMLRAIDNALAPHQEEMRQHAAIAKELLLVKIHATDEAANAVKPLYADVRDVVMPDARTGDLP